MTDSFGNEFVDTGNAAIEEAMEDYYMNPGDATLLQVLESLRAHAKIPGHLLMPVSRRNRKMYACTYTLNDKEWNTVFTSFDAAEKAGCDFQLLSTWLSDVFDQDYSGLEGFVINPLTNQFYFNKQLMDVFRKGAGWDE